MLGAKLTGPWARTIASLGTMADRLQRAGEWAVAREATYLSGQMRRNLVSGGQLAGRPFAKLSPGTLVVRAFRGFGGTKPLVVSGALLGAISAVKVAGGWFVGVKRVAGKGKGGANLAELHERGASWTQPMTAKMRRFLAAAYRRAGLPFGSGGKGTGVLRIRIPARPFVGPVLERFAKPEDVRRRFWESVSRSMGGELGR